MQRLLRFLVPALIAFALGVTPALAFEQYTAPSVLVGLDQTVNDDVFAAGNDITVAGHITGDLYAFGQTITLAGGSRVDGDVIGAAQTVIVAGSVGGSVRVAGQAVQVQTGTRIGGGLVTAAQDATIDGDVVRGMAAAAQQLSLGGQVGKEVRASVGALSILPTAKVAGDLIYTSTKQAVIPQGAVGGRVRYIPSARSDQATPAANRLPGSAFGIIWLLGNLIVGLLLVSLFPRLRDVCRTEMVERPLVAFGAGVIALVATPIIAVLLMITLIGIPLGLIGVAGYVVFTYLGWLLAAYVLGFVLLRFALARSDGLRRAAARNVLLRAAGWQFFYGFVVLAILRSIPYVGGLTAFLGVSFGLGSLVLVLYRAMAGRKVAALTVVETGPVVPIGPIAPQPR